MNIKALQSFLKVLACTSMLLVAAQSTYAQTPISFDLSAINTGDVTKQITSNGVTATFTALNDWTHAFIFNETTPQFDTGLQPVPVLRRQRPDSPFSGAKFSVTFDAHVTIRSFDSYTGEDRAEYDNDKLEITTNGELARRVWLESDTLDPNGWSANNMLTTVLTVAPGQIVEFEYFDTADDNGPNAAIYLTSMNVTLVPEPSTYAFLLGLGALGFAACRRRRRH